jgi:hypothetical protein
MLFIFMVISIEHIIADFFEIIIFDDVIIFVILF